jgi:hypothetical protein
VTVALLTLGVGLNGGIYSGFKVNHLDLSPRLAGVLMSITNCMANLAGLMAPLVAGHLTHRRVSLIPSGQMGPLHPQRSNGPVTSNFLVYLFLPS